MHLVTPVTQKENLDCDSLHGFPQHRCCLKIMQKSCGKSRVVNNNKNADGFRLLSKAQRREKGADEI